MVIISFSVLKDKVLDGSKTRTMRPALYGGKENTKWKRVYEKWNLPVPAQISIPLQIYWKQRSAKIVGYECPLCHDVNFDLALPCRKCGGIELPTQIKEGHKLFDAVLTNITRKKLGDLTEAEWIADGFEPKGNWTATFSGLYWFHNMYKMSIDFGDINLSQELLNFEIYIIEFRRV